MSNQTTAVVIGASSGLGRSFCEKLCAIGWNIVGSSSGMRDLDALESHLNLTSRGNFHAISIDLASTFNANDYRDACYEKLGKIDHVFITAGHVDIEDNGLQSQASLERIIKINYLSITALISAFTKRMLNENGQRIVVFTSIAAKAPRGRNTVYASAKGALELYCKGWQHSLQEESLKLQVYSPGYLETAMTFGVNLAFAPLPTHKAVRIVLRNLKKETRFTYLPSYWRMITLVLQHLPWFIYKRLSF